MKRSIFFMLALSLVVAACNTENREYYGQDGEYYNEKTAQYVSDKNEFSQIDSYKPRTMKEREEADARWNTSRKETRWQEYKGTMVRIEVLLGNSSVREMRLRLMQNADGADVDADAKTVLSRVADFEMKKICGRNAESIVVVYDKPSFEVMRPTSFFEYRVEAEGDTMREYGFRCVYNK